MSPVSENRALKLRGDRPNNRETESKSAYRSRIAVYVHGDPRMNASLPGCRSNPRDFDRLRSSTGLLLGRRGAKPTSVPDVRTPGGRSNEPYHVDASKPMVNQVLDSPGSSDLGMLVSGAVDASDARAI